MDVRIKNDIKIIYVDSSLYSDNAEKFREIINSSIDKKDRKINLNLKKMNSINSHIMGEILELYNTIKNRGGELILSEAANDISELFRITKVSKIVRTFETEEEGSSYLEKQ